MQIPLLPLVLGAIVVTFGLAVLGWWVGSRVERRRRTTRRLAETERFREQQGGPGPLDGRG